MLRMTRNLVSLVPCVLIFASGCSAFSDPVGDVQRHLGVPVHPTTVQVDKGTLTFYRYVQGAQCGRGLVYDLYGFRGSGGGGAGLCASAGSFTVSAMNAYAGGGGKHPFAVIYGEVKDRNVVRISVLTKGDSKPLAARVVDGWWYVFLDGRGAIPEVDTTIGYDKDGKEITSAP